jgi:5-methyltetrahydrofolate--homocysteine methyltransferase
MDTLIKSIYDNILEGQQKVVEAKTQEALNSGIPPKVILDEGMVAAMAEVGRLFETGEYFVPEMMVAARAMKAGLALLKPQLVKANVKSLGKVGIGTVQGDLHDIGKNLVGIMLEGAGYEILDLGTDVSPEKFIQAVKTDKVDALALSALLTTTMPNMISTITALEQAGLRKQVKVLIGGAPITEEYARQIGADGYAPDASRAVTIAKGLLAKINA